MGNSIDINDTGRMEGTRFTNRIVLKGIAPYFAFACSGFLLGVLISMDHSLSDILLRIGLGSAVIVVGAIGVAFSREMAVKRDQLSRRKAQEKLAPLAKAVAESNFYQIYREDSTSTSIKQGVPTWFYQLEASETGEL
jgi:hypothetical protein